MVGVGGEVKEIGGVVVGVVDKFLDSIGRDGVPVVVFVGEFNDNWWWSGGGGGFVVVEKFSNRSGE